MNTFDVMGVPPLLGRTTTPDDAGRTQRRSPCSATASGSGSSAAIPACWAGSCA